MNIIVANKYRDLINGSGIEILKEINGVFKVSEIANSFSSIFYNKIIIDATALENYPKGEVLRELANKFDSQKLILFIPPDDAPPMNFLSFLVSINIYNFTDNIKGLAELIDKSNSYEDIKEFVKSNKNINRNLDENFKETINSNSNGKVILGVKSITEGVYSTMLIYMLKNILKNVYKKNVVAVEYDKNDFVYYNDKTMFSISKNKLGEFFNNNSLADIILVDLPQKGEIDSKICTDIIYLIEPSIYHINKLLYTNRLVFNNLKGKKIVLVNSLLNQNDINLFAREAGISIYYNLVPLNDRVVNNNLSDFLFKLGLIDMEKPKSGFFDRLKG